MPLPSSPQGCSRKRWVASPRFPSCLSDWQPGDARLRAFLVSGLLEAEVSNLRPPGQIWPAEVLYLPHVALGLSQRCPFSSAAPAEALGRRDGRRQRTLRRRCRARGVMEMLPRCWEGPIMMQATVLAAPFWVSISLHSTAKGSLRENQVTITCLMTSLQAVKQAP